MNSISIFLILIPIVLSLVFCDIYAKKKGLDRKFWRYMCLLFGPFAIPFIFFAKPTESS